MDKTLPANSTIRNRVQINLQNTTNKRFVFKNVTEVSVSKYGLKPKPSAGTDNISNRLIKIIKEDIVPFLTMIINQSLETGIFPESLKIIPLFKKKKIIDPLHFSIPFLKYLKNVSINN